MSNPWKDYLQNFRDNLPTGVTYRGDIARYVFNDKRFILPNDVVRYKNYLEKLGFSAFDPDALAYITAVETADGEPLEAGVKVAINDFVVGCKADAIWDALKASCILAGARTLNGCLVPLTGAAPTNFNFVSADYNRVTGLKGDGSTKYLNSNRAGNADPKENLHSALWQTELHTASSFSALIASRVSGQPPSQILDSLGSDLHQFNARSTASTTISGRVANSLVGMSLSGADLSAVASGKSATSTITPDDAAASEWEVFSRSGGDTASNARLSFYSIGESIDLAALDTRVSALMEDLAFTLNTGLSPADYDRDTINYVNAGYAAGGSLE